MTPLYIPFTLDVNMTTTQLKTTEIERLATCAEHRTFSAGEYLLHRSEITNSIFYIKRGTVAVLQKNKDPLAGEIVIHSGEFLGEISFLLDKPRTATIVAREETECLVFDPKRLRSFLFQPENDALGRSFYQSLAWIAANRLVSSPTSVSTSMVDDHDPLKQHIQGRIYSRLIGFIEIFQTMRKTFGQLMRRAYQLRYDDSVFTDSSFAQHSEEDLNENLNKCQAQLHDHFQQSIAEVNSILSETHSSFRRDACGVYAREVCGSIFQAAPFFRHLCQGGFSETLSVLTQIYQGHHSPPTDPLLGDGNLALMINHWLLKLPTFCAMRSAFELLKSEVSDYIARQPRADEMLKVTLLNDLSGGVLAGIFVPLAKRRSNVRCVVDQWDGVEAVLPWNGYSKSVLVSQEKLDFSMPNTLFDSPQDVIVVSSLLDYVPDTIAEGFLTHLRDALHDSGKLYLSCLCETEDQPFVTSVLNWSTVRRNEQQLQMLLRSIGMTATIVSSDDGLSLIVCASK